VSAERLVTAALGVALAASGLLGWLSTPLQGTIPGYAFTLAGDLPLAHAVTRPLRPFSAGTLVLVLGVVTVAASLRRRVRAGFWLGAGALLVALYAGAGLLYLRPEVLEAVVEQNAERQNIKGFDRSHFGGNAAGMFVAQLGTEFPADRAAAVVYLLGFGWQLAVAAGLVLQALALWRGRRTLRWDALAFLALAPLMLAAVSWRGVIADYEAAGARDLAARGMYEPARAAYERARAWNPKLIHNPDQSHRLGEVYTRLGLRDHPEAFIYRGDLRMEQGEFPEAIEAYGRALALEPDHPVARRMRNGAHVAAGLAHYQAGRVHKAVASWEYANTLDTLQIETHFYLAKAQLDTKRFEAGIRESRQALALTRDRLVRSDIFLLLGDCHYQLQDFATARVAYQSSLEQYVSVVDFINVMARRKLQGL